MWTRVMALVRAEVCEEGERGNRGANKVESWNS